MNRIEFMTQLAALLQDVPVEERREAMQYYNDYFDDAGAEKEQEVIAELESPKKVAENIKADLKGTSVDNGEFTENGYEDARFNDREMPEKRGYEYQRQSGQKEPIRTSNALKIILIIAIILVGGPILIPVALSLMALVAGSHFTEKWRLEYEKRMENILDSLWCDIPLRNGVLCCIAVSWRDS